MNWYVTALISAVALSAQFLCMQRLQKTYPIQVYMAITWIGAAFILGLAFVRSADVFKALGDAPILLLGGAASWGGMYAYNLAIRHQPNLGYIEAISGTRLAMVYCVSLLIFRAVVDDLRLLALIGVVVGVILVARSRTNAASRNDKSWPIWALVSGISFAVLVICTRLATSRGLDARAATAFILFIAGVIFLISPATQREYFRPSGALPFLFGAVVFAALGNVALFISYSGAPNLAYPVAVSNSRIVLLYLIAIVRKTDRLEFAKTIGVVLTFVSVALLS